ncbi:MAG TPA: glycosyltransferase family 2 protein [bacterium]|nr:glycosyltransferase family 2 protein [bacterium]HPN31866.1 glycosyltransferase family 2 protein [bacterium]
MKTIELSVVVLCYRSEEHIIPFVDKLIALIENLTKDWQIVLVGNYIEGSNDRTKEIIKEIARGNKKIKTVIEPKQGMMGWDMRKGLAAADGEFLCVIDGDGQFPIESIEQCYRIISEKKLDMVKTYRSKRFDGFYRILISKIYNILFKLLFPDTKFKDANSKPKILSRNAYNQMILTANDWFIDAEIMLNVRRLKLKYEEFPIHFFNITERSSFVKFGAIFEFIRNLLIHRIKEFKLLK